MGRVTNEEFISHLTTLYTSTASSGSVYLTSKRLTYGPLLAAQAGQDSRGNSLMTSSSSSSLPSPSSSSSSSYPLLFRLTNGKSSSSKLSLSTQVSPHDLVAFQDTLSSTMRTCLSGCLRKRDKAKERKIDKILAARKKKDEELGGWKGVAKLGKKRGAGHRQRQRAQKRAMKLRTEERQQLSKAKAAAGQVAAGSGEGATPVIETEVQDSKSAAQSQQQSAPGTGAGGGGGSKKKKKGGKR